MLVMAGPISPVQGLNGYVPLKTQGVRPASEAAAAQQRNGADGQFEKLESGLGFVVDAQIPDEYTSTALLTPISIDIAHHNERLVDLLRSYQDFKLMQYDPASGKLNFSGNTILRDPMNRLANAHYNNANGSYSFFSANSPDLVPVFNREDKLAIIDVPNKPSAAPSKLITSSSLSKGLFAALENDIKEQFEAIFKTVQILSVQNFAETQRTIRLLPWGFKESTDHQSFTILKHPNSPNFGNHSDSRADINIITALIMAAQKGWLDSSGRRFLHMYTQEFIDKAVKMFPVTDDCGMTQYFSLFSSGGFVSAEVSSYVDGQAQLRYTEYLPSYPDYTLLRYIAKYFENSPYIYEKFTSLIADSKRLNKAIQLKFPTWQAIPRKLQIAVIPTQSDSLKLPTDIGPLLHNIYLRSSTANPVNEQYPSVPNYYKAASLLNNPRQYSPLDIDPQGSASAVFLNETITMNHTNNTLPNLKSAKYALNNVGKMTGRPWSEKIGEALWGVNQELIIPGEPPEVLDSSLRTKNGELILAGSIKSIDSALKRVAVLLNMSSGDPFVPRADQQLQDVFSYLLKKESLPDTLFMGGTREYFSEYIKMLRVMRGFNDEEVNIRINHLLSLTPDIGNTNNALLGAIYSEKIMNWEVLSPQERTQLKAIAPKFALNGLPALIDYMEQRVYPQQSLQIIPFKADINGVVVDSSVQTKPILWGFADVPILPGMPISITLKKFMTEESIKRDLIKLVCSNTPVSYSEKVETIISKFKDEFLYDKTKNELLYIGKMSKKKHSIYLDVAPTALKSAIDQLYSFSQDPKFSVDKLLSEFKEYILDLDKDYQDYAVMQLAYQRQLPSELRGKVLLWWLAEISNKNDKYFMPRYLALAQASLGLIAEDYEKNGGKPKFEIAKSAKPVQKMSDILFPKDPAVWSDWSTQSSASPFSKNFFPGLWQDFASRNFYPYGDQAAQIMGLGYWLVEGLEKFNDQNSTTTRNEIWQMMKRIRNEVQRAFPIDFKTHSGVWATSTLMDLLPPQRPTDAKAEKVFNALIETRARQLVALEGGQYHSYYQLLGLEARLLDYPGPRPINLIPRLKFIKSEMLRSRLYASYAKSISELIIKWEGKL